MKKVGIVTFYNAYNYGAFFQQYALGQFLTDNGFDADIINYTSRFINLNSRHAMNIILKGGLMKKAAIIYMFFFRHREWRDKIRWQKKFADCIKRELKVSEPFAYADKERFNQHYDFFIAGSDQVWNTSLTDNDFFYFLDFAHKDKKRTYAVSLGFDKWKKGQRELYAEKLGDYKHVLVREKSAGALLGEIGISSDTVLDPTMLVPPEKWVEFAKKSSIVPPKKYIMVYIVQTPFKLIQAAKKYALENGCELILVCASNRNIVMESGTLKAQINISPYDFMNYLLNAETMFTTSFHGLALSLCCGINVCYELSKNADNKNTRLENIAEALGVTHRELADGKVPDKPIDYDDVNKRLKELREFSAEKLLSSLN